MAGDQSPNGSTAAGVAPAAGPLRWESVLRIFSWSGGPSRNGSPPGRDRAIGSAEGRSGGRPRFQLELADLLGRDRVDWRAVGREVGEQAGSLDAYRRLVHAYFGYRGELAERLAALPEDPAPDASADDDAREREQALREQISGLDDDLRELTDLRWTDPRTNLRKALQENQEEHVRQVRGLNEKLSAALLSRLDDKQPDMSHVVKVHRAFTERITSLQLQLAQAADAPKQAAIRDDLELLERDFRHAVEFGAEMDRVLRTEVQASFEAQNSFVQAAARMQQTRMEQDSELIRRSLNHLEEPVVAKRSLSMAALFVAVFAAAVAEFAVINKYTGNVLDLGVFSSELNRLTRDGFQAGAFINLLSLFCFALIPFSLGFWVKTFIEAGLPRRGEAQWWLTIILVSAAGLYLLSLARLIGVRRNPMAGAVFFFLSITLIVLNGWLLHLFLRAVDDFLKSRRDARRRRRELGAEKSAREREIANLRAERQHRAERFARERERRLVEREAWQVASQVAADGSGSSDARAAMAALDAGYAEGVVIRATARRDLPRTPETEDQLSELWRRVQLLRNVSPVEGVLPAAGPPPPAPAAATGTKGASASGSPEDVLGESEPAPAEEADTAVDGEPPQP